MKKLLVAGLMVLAVAVAAPAFADEYSLLTSGSGATINNGFGDAYITQGGTLSGTGRFPAFVQVSGTAQTDNLDPNVRDAYNTTVNNTNDNGPSDVHNHSITFSQLVEVDCPTGGGKCYQFLLDINENNNSTDQWLSLDQIVLLTSTSANQSSEELPTGTTRWSLDTTGDDNRILLDYALNTGSGKFDMTLFIPTSYFAGALPGDFVYLYSRFGEKGLVAGKDWGVTDGFEEWALTNTASQDPCTVEDPCFNVVPEPGSLVLLGAGLLGTAFALRRRMKKA